MTHLGVIIEYLKIKGVFMKKNLFIKYLLIGVVSSVNALADMNVDKSTGVLVVTSTITGTVIAKVVGPDDKIVVNEKYEGNSFTWVPSGIDGAYRYDVRVIPKTTKVSSVDTVEKKIEASSNMKSDYAGGSIEVTNGQIQTNEEEK